MHQPLVGLGVAVLEVHAGEQLGQFGVLYAVVAAIVVQLVEREEGGHTQSQLKTTR